MTATVDPKRPPAVLRPSGEGEEVFLTWERVIDDGGCVRCCPVCGCRDIFVRKDFPQAIGFTIVLLAGLGAMVLFGLDQVIWAGLLLISVVAIDVVAYFFVPKCLVCYRCRSEFRDTPIAKDQKPWDLSIGEKYRQAAIVEENKETPR